MAKWVALIVVIIGVGAGGYMLGHNSRPGAAVQMKALNINTGHSHWVTLSRRNCSLPSPHYVGEAVCSWLGQIRVAP